MPVQYASILEEARTVRSAVGLFDLSHMGRVRVVGPERVRAVNRFCTNNAAMLEVGDIRYSLVCNERGGVIDDVLIYGEEDGIFIVVNAANCERDLAHFRAAAAAFDAEVLDLTDELAMLALQGPASEAVLCRCTDDPGAIRDLGYYKITRARVLDMPAVRVSRTGYTGEDGFELYFPPAEAERVWKALLERGAAEGLRPCGLGARDTLRLEAGMALYGHELTEDINPLEAGLKWAVKFAKGKDFIGRPALEQVKAAGPARQLVGLVGEGKRIPRHGYKVKREGAEVGFVCSGAFSPTLGKNIATAYVPAALAAGASDLAIDIRGRDEPVTLVPLPFYKRET
jgi:aminomethyltransferase